VSETVAGWRAFGLGPAGELVAPFVVRYWPEMDTDPAWPPEGAVARCLDQDHQAPAEGCTCGLRATLGLTDLIKALGRKFAGSSTTILDETGVIARVELSGRILDGVDMPRDDPPGTNRGERARVLEVHLAPTLTAAAQAVQDRYAVPVRVYLPADWPGQVGRPDRPSGREGFLGYVHRAGFGKVRIPDRVLEQLARDAIAAMREGVPAGDIVTELFRSAPRPRYEQAKGFVEAAILYLAPELEFVDRGIQFSVGVKVKEAITQGALLDGIFRR
jgi:hypothetical protein